jgi:ABC-2 type transport system ATP-binding protein
MTEPAVVSIERVTKRYAGHTAVSDFSLTIPQGTIYGLLGPNGAGKTTTIRMIMDIIVPDEGSVTLFDQTGTGRDVSARIGYLPEERGLYKKMKIVDLLVFFAEMKGVPRATAKVEAVRWLEKLGLGDWKAKRVDDLSKGMQQKVQFIATVLHGPDLLILDEPFSGFDPVNTQLIKDVVIELNKAGTTVLFSTHIMEQAEKLCSSVCIIARGRKVVDGLLAEVKAGHRGGQHVVVGVAEGLDAIARVLADSSLVSAVDAYGGYAELELVDGADPQRVLRGIVDSGATVTRFEISEPTLNKIFIDLVGAEAAVPEAREDERHA